MDAWLWLAVPVTVRTKVMVVGKVIVLPPLVVAKNPVSTEVIV